MKESIHTPKGLAKLVHKKLEGATIPYPLPDEELLFELFQTLFFTSLKTEEGQFIKVTITLIDPANPDPTPPERIVANRWNYISFTESISYTVKNLVKLSKAADPWSSSLAVYYNSKNELIIWGMIDQAVHYQSFLNYESDDGPEQPGLFQTTITGIGSLNVIFDYELIANLKQNVLISNYIDIFNYGQVKEQLILNSQSHETKINSFLVNEFPDTNSNAWKGAVTTINNESLSRILLKIQSNQHGGAILITNKIKSDLDIKHKIEYNRLSKSIINYIKLTISNSIFSTYIDNNYLNLNEEYIPTEQYLDENVSEFERQETNDELKGAIRFISSLSNIDGLVVLSPELNVKGFGAVIEIKKIPDLVYKSSTSVINDEKLLPINPNHFGTRHRSMFSYCWNNNGSIGFVVSQDGDIRAIMRVGDKLIMWENIKVQQFIRSNRLKRLFKIKKRLN